MTEDCTTAGAAKEFVANIRTSSMTRTKFLKAETSFRLEQWQAVLQLVGFHN
jgi:hypothetical protein